MVDPRLEGYVEALADADVPPAKRIALVVRLLQKLTGLDDRSVPRLTCAAKLLLAYPPCHTFPAAGDPVVTDVL